MVTVPLTRKKQKNKTNGLERFNGNSFNMSEFLFETAFFFASVDSSEIFGRTNLNSFG